MGFFVHTATRHKQLKVKKSSITISVLKITLLYVKQPFYQPAGNWINI